MAERLIAGGAFVKIVADSDTIGLASGVSYDEDWAVNPANVIGHLGPIAFDSQGYSCSITMQSFLPVDLAQNAGGRQNLPGKTDTVITDLLPTRQEIQDAGGKPREIDTLQFIDILTGVILSQFKDVSIASNGVQVSPNSYITMNIRMVAIERINVFV